MLQSPVKGGYPGKYVCFGMAAFLVFMLYRISRSTVSINKKQRNDAAEGVSFKPDPRKSIGGHVLVALVAAYLLATIVAAIYKSWPN